MLDLTKDLGIELRSLFYAMLTNAITQGKDFQDYAALLEPMGLVLVDIRRSSAHNGLQMTMSIKLKEGLVGVDECAHVYNLVYPRLELENPGMDIELEVSTPGVSRNFKDVWEFKVFQGSRVRVYSTSLAKWVIGNICASNETCTTLTQVVDENAQQIAESLDIDYDDIQKARLDINWEDMKKCPR
jgi:ribosome maturation factor RimP